MEKNKHGVEGILEGTFINPNFIPQCCLDCQHLEDNYGEHYSENYIICLKNVFFPTKKGTCKKQEKW